MKFPFVFKSPNAGVFTEQWKFETRPSLCGGAALIVTLRGIALQEDKFQREREELEVRKGWILWYREWGNKRGKEGEGWIIWYRGGGIK